MKKVLKVIRKEDDQNVYHLNEDIISLETGAHFNNGQKFFEFSNILDENDNQEDVFNNCGFDDMCDQFLKRG